MSRPIVAVVRTDTDTVLEDIRRVMEAAGYRQHLDRNRPLILKTDLSWHLPFPAANTTPWQLEGVVKTLLETGYHELSVVHNQSPEACAYRGEQQNHYISVYNKYHLEVRYNFEPGDMHWIPYAPKEPLRALDRIFPDGLRIPEYFVGRQVVHLPTIKTHVHTTVGGAVKNAFGGLLDDRRYLCAGEMGDCLVDLLAIQKEILPGMFCVADGTTCGNGAGPRTMTPVTKDLLLASADPVALDAVMATLMGFDPMQIDYLRVAHDRGLGVARLQEIDVTGLDIHELRFGFTLGDHPAAWIQRVMKGRVLRRLRPVLDLAPLVKVTQTAAHLYHDYGWYPTRGRPHLERWLDSPWGQLFQQYGATMPAAQPRVAAQA